MKTHEKTHEMKLIGKSGAVLWLLVLLTYSTQVVAAESYPAFDRDYWSNEQDLAKGKIQRGAGLGVLGLVSIWPTSMMIGKAIDNPQRYLALSMVFGLSTIGGTMHGFGSVGYGKKQKDKATEFVDLYDNQPDAVSAADEQAEYIHNQRKTATKLLIFGSFFSTQGAILLGNGIVQSVRKNRGENMDEITIWPYYVAGGVMLSLGAAIIVKSAKRINEIDQLEESTPTPASSGLAPLVALDDTGHLTWGLSYGIGF